VPESLIRHLASTLLRWLVAALKRLVQIAVITWTTLAIYYSNLPWSELRLGLAVAFAAFAVWAFWLARHKRMPTAAFAVAAGVLVWWLTITPSQHRNWRPEVAVVPRASIDGDHVHLTGVRNFDYRSRNDFTEHYEARDVDLSHLIGLDFFISHWSEGPVGHTFVSFIFDNVPPLSISIETRPEKGRGFEPIASLFKQFELIYVVGEERDLVGVRAIHRRETVYLYRLNTRPQDVRQLFLVYLTRINQLADRPEFYNLLTNSCTINIIRYANAAGRRGRFDIRHLLNGLIGSYLYASGRIDTSLPFDELRRRSQINEAAQAADGAPEPEFSRRIRASLPTMAR
jgi:hypothetical protein